MKNTIKWAISILLAILVSSCNSTPEEKVRKAVQKYQQDGYTILSQSENPTKDEHFVLVQKDNQIYYDGLSGRKSKYLVFPKEDGYYIKQVQLTLKDGIPSCSFALLNEGNRTALSGNDYDIIKDDKLKGKQTLVFANKEAVYNPRYVYSLSNPDTLFSLGEWKGFWIENDYFLIQYCKSFEKIFGANYKDNTFDVLMRFSTVDMSFGGINDSFGIDADYDIDYIKNKYPGFVFIENNNQIRFPLSWFGTPDINTIKEAIDNYESETDRILKEIDRLMKKNESENKKIKNSQNNNNRHQSNQKIWVSCPYCGGRGWQEAIDYFSGRRTQKTCSMCGGQRGHWEYY